MPGINRVRYCGTYIKRSLIRLNLGPYWFWAFLRVLLTIIPQTGYIHPDEFFQSVEIFAGNVFKTEVTIPWEFNATFPIRSIPVMYIATSLPLSLLRMASSLISPKLLSPYFLVVVPRLFICFLSFSSDYCLYKICYLYGQNFRRRLLVYASSYVTLVYCTRTFSNAIEMILFNILLYLVATCMAESEKPMLGVVKHVSVALLSKLLWRWVVDPPSKRDIMKGMVLLYFTMAALHVRNWVHLVNYQDDFLMSKYEEASTTADRVRIWKLRKLLPSHSIANCFPIAFVVVAGVFNRPTFLTYAVPPVFYWLQRGIRRDEPLLHFHSRFILLLLSSIPVAFLFVVLDSTYYGYLTWGEVITGRVSLQSFVLTPINFLRYNLDKENLAEHGLHPRWLHIVVNLPLLFNFLAVACILVVLNMLYRGSQAYWTQLPKPQSITGMMSLSAIVPVVALSVIPHQEPRFIAPILVPLVFLYSHIITQFVEDCPAPAPRPSKLKQLPFLSAFDNRPNITGRFLTLINCEAVTGKVSTGIGRYELLKWWFLINLIFTAFYGFVHQGQVYSVAKHFREELDIQPKYTIYHLLYSHTYPIPQYLFMQPRTSARASTFSTVRLSSDLEKNLERIATMIKTAEEMKRVRRRNYRIFYALPASVFFEFEALHLMSKDKMSIEFSYKIKKIFFPHLSLEAPFRLPDVSSLTDVLSLLQLILIEIESIEIDSDQIVR